MKGYVFIKNTVIMTVTSLILRAIGMFFRIYLAGEIGAEGIGLYQMIFSVYVLAATFATTGISTAVTRLIAENSSSGRKGEGEIMQKSLLITSGFALLSVGIVFFGSDFIATILFKDQRATLSLKIMAFSLPFMGFCSCFRGYLIAKRKTMSPCMSQVLEQFVRMGVVIAALTFVGTEDIEKCTAAVLLGDCFAEAFSALMLYIVYKRDLSKVKTEGAKISGVENKILKISLPIMGGKYMSSALHTAENLLVPNSLNKFSQKQDGLVFFGDLKGMALPLLFFPASFLSALATMLIPEISESYSKGDELTVKSSVSRTLETTLLLSIFAGACFLVCGDIVGQVVYKSDSIGYLLRALAPIVPFMYLESVMTGVLKGLDKQNAMFLYNLVDSVARIISVIFLVPQYGTNGFLAVMTVSNIMTSGLCCKTVLKASGVKMQWTKNVIIPTAVSVGSVIASRWLFNFIVSTLLKCIVIISFSGLVYLVIYYNRLTRRNKLQVVRAKQGLFFGKNVLQ